MSDNWPWPQISTPSLNLYSRFRPPNPYPYMPRDCMHKQIKRTSKTATWPGGGLATQLTIPDSLATGSERLDTIYHHATITRGDLLPFQVSWGSREGRLNRPGRLDEMPAFLDDQVTTVHCISCSLSIVPCLLFGMNAYWVTDTFQPSREHVVGIWWVITTVGRTKQTSQVLWSKGYRLQHFSHRFWCM